MFSQQFKFNSIFLNAELHSAGAFIYDECVKILQLELDNWWIVLRLKSFFSKNVWLTRNFFTNLILMK